MRTAACLSFLFTCVLGASEEAPRLRIVTCDPIVRAEQAYRCTVQKDIAPGPRQEGTFLVQIALLQHGKAIASFETTLENLGQLQQGIVPVMFVRGDIGAEAVTLQAVLSTPFSQEREIATAKVDTPLMRKQELQTLYDRVREKKDTPTLVHLWIEQGAQLASEGESLLNLGELAEVNQRLAAWLDGKGLPQPTASTVVELAFRDATDGSVQPFRLRLPAEVSPRMPLALLLEDAEQASSKAHWHGTKLPLSMADGVGIAVAEVYPAGDSSWTGIAVQRCDAVLNALKGVSPAFDIDHPILIGVGHGAQGALRLAESDPDRFRIAALVDPKLDMPQETKGSEYWLAQRRFGGLRPQNLYATSLGACGKLDGGAERWRNTLTSVVTLASPEKNEFWKWLLEHRHGAVEPQGRYAGLILAPGHYGRLTVRALNEWGTPVQAMWSEDNLSLTGAAGFSIERPAKGTTVNGKPYKAAKIDDGKGARKILGSAQGPLDGYALGPFVVVYGTSENEVAATDNVDLANAFLSAWVEHSQGAPPKFADCDFEDKDFPAHHLVLIGNSRSNSALARLVEKGMRLPLTWDAREVHFGQMSFARGDRRPVALAWPHPANDGRLLVILDGTPIAAKPHAMPLAGLPDLVIGAPPDRPHEKSSYEVWRLFDCNWR